MSISNFWELEHFGNALAFVEDNGRSMTYQEAARDADLFACHCGKTKKLVFLVCNNDIESNIAYLGCLRSGHVPLLLRADIDGDLLEKLAVKYRPQFVWQRTQRLSLYTYGHYSLAATQYVDLPQVYPDLALLLATSGTTGSPKLVRLSYDNIAGNAAAISTYLALTPEERAITVLPMSYSYGLSVINSHLLVGARILLSSASIIQKYFWDFFKQHRATSLVGVPYTYAIYERMGLFNMQLPSLRYLTQAGGKLTSEKVVKIAKITQTRGIRFYVMYGQTEATARMSYLPPECAIEKSASVGRPIPGGRFSIVNVNGEEVNNPGFNGELIYYGSNVSLGYAECRDDLKKTDDNRGVLRTGDIAYLDADGFLYITGRLRRIIKIAGNRIGLDDLEDFFSGNDIEAFCGGKDDLLCIAVRGKADVIRAKQLIEDKFGFHYSMYKFVIVDNFHRNDFGKISYQDLFMDLLNA